MYEELLERVMGDDVTLEDWKKYQSCYEDQMNSQHESLAERIRWMEENRQMLRERMQEFVAAARHVVTQLSLEDIAQDTALMVAYEELQHPEKFS